MSSDPRLLSPLFPRSAKYNPDWILSNASGGANVLWMTEWLSTAMDLRPGMRILDLACGRAASSIFLRREFGVQVWATDLWFSATENLRALRDVGVDDGVFPIHADARALPFAHEFFDAITCLDAYPYFGTDDTYLDYLARFVRPGGQIGIAGAGLTREIDGNVVPEHLRDWWTPSCWALHSADWWRRHWQRSGVLDIEVADTLQDGWRLWLDWHHTGFPDNLVEIRAVEEDAGRYLGYARVVGRRRKDAKFEQVMTSVETQYVPKPLLRK